MGKNGNTSVNIQNDRGEIQPLWEPIFTVQLSCTTCQSEWPIDFLYTLADFFAHSLSVSMSMYYPKVRNPNIGEDKPASVQAHVTYDTKGLRGEVRSEWDELKQHDVVFMLTVVPPDPSQAASMYTDGQGPEDPRLKYGLAYVRGCEVIEVKDEAGKLMNDFTGVEPQYGFPHCL